MVVAVLGEPPPPVVVPSLVSRVAWRLFGSSLGWLLVGWLVGWLVVVVVVVYFGCFYMLFILPPVWIDTV